MGSTKWAGRTVTRARAYWLPLLPLPCPRCGLPVLPDQRWHVGHIVDRALGGSDELSNTRPEHGRCNEAAGGRLGVELGRGAAAASSAARRRRPAPRPVVAVPAVDRRSW